MSPAPWRLPLYALVVGIAVLAVLPLWLVPILPAAGWTESLHVARVLSDVLANGPDEFHGRLWVATPISLVPYGLALLGPKIGFVLAERVLGSLAILALPWAWLAWLRASGRSPWLVLAALPWLMGPAYLQGDLPQLVAWPLWFAALAAQLAAMQRAGWWRWLLVALSVTALAVAHPVPWLTIVGLLPILALLQSGRVGWRAGFRHLVATLLTLVPGVLLLLPWVRKVLASVGGSRGFAQAWRTEWWLPGDNVRQLADLSLDGFGNHGPRIDALRDLSERAGELLAFAWLLAVATWLAASIRQGREAAKAPRTALANPHPVHALAALTIGYFLLPARLIAPLPLSQFAALLPPVMAMIAPLAIPLDPFAPPAAMRRRVWLASGALLIVAATLPFFAMRSTLLDAVTFGPMQDAFRVIPANQRVCTVLARSDIRHVRAGVHDDIAAWPLILGGGLVNEPVPEVLWTPVVEKANGHLPYLPRGQDLKLEEARACQYIAVFRDPGVQIEDVMRAIKPLPRLYSRGTWDVYQNLRPVPWPPPTWLTPQVERMVACATAQLGLVPLQMPAEQVETMQVRARLGWNIRCVDPSPAPANVEAPKRLPVALPPGVPAAPSVLH